MNMVLSEVEEQISTLEVDETTRQENIKVRIDTHHAVCVANKSGGAAR
jgi:small nuclear ribonucleoprotein (snRNP)-like protein